MKGAVFKTRFRGIKLEMLAFTNTRMGNGAAPYRDIRGVFRPPRTGRRKDDTARRGCGDSMQSQEDLIEHDARIAAQVVNLLRIKKNS